MVPVVQGLKHPNNLSEGNAQKLDCTEQQMLTYTDSSPDLTN